MSRKTASKSEKNTRCSLCDTKFSSTFCYKRHMDYKHGNDSLLVNRKFECNECGKNFSRKDTLVRHISMKHVPESQHYECYHCGRKFHQKYNLDIHIQRVHKDDKARDAKGLRYTCVLCSITLLREQLLLNHFEKDHRILIETENLKFDSHENFKNWKKNMEKRTWCVYNRDWDLRRGGKEEYICHRTGYYNPVKSRVRRLKMQGSKKINGYCPSRIRVFWKADGSCTISFIKTHVGHAMDHSELKHVKVSKETKNIIATKIAAGISTARILEDMTNNFKHSPGNLEKVHLLTLRDIDNVARNLKPEFQCQESFEAEDYDDGDVNSSDTGTPNDAFPSKGGYEIDAKCVYVKNGTDFLITEDSGDFSCEKEYACKVKYEDAHEDVESIVVDCPADGDFVDETDDYSENVAVSFAFENTKDVLFCKRPGERSIKYPSLHANDFVIILMNDRQTDVLKKYGPNVVALDLNHGTTSNSFSLYTILVLDEYEEAYPCTYMLTNRNDKTAVDTLFSCVRDKIGAMKIVAFLSAMRPMYFDSWTQVMKMEPEFHHYSNWHVRRAWEINYGKINGRAKREAIKKELDKLHTEYDEKKFYEKLEAFMAHEYDPDVNKFVVYFKENFCENVQLWACCYKKYAGINTNVNIERFHVTFKRYYRGDFAKSQVQDVLCAVEQYMIVKCREDVQKQIRGKLCAQIKFLRRAHNEAEAAMKRISTLTKQSEESWLIESFTTKGVTYVITRSDKVYCTDTCKMLCDICKICKHRFTCTCAENTYRSIMCKHIHYLCLREFQEIVEIFPETYVTCKSVQMLQETNKECAEPTEQMQEISHSKKLPFKQADETICENNVALPQCSNFNKEDNREKLRKKFENLLQIASSKEQLLFLRDSISEINPAITSFDTSFGV